MLGSFGLGSVLDSFCFDSITLLISAPELFAKFDAMLLFVWTLMQIELVRKAIQFFFEILKNHDDIGSRFLVCVSGLSPIMVI